MRDKAFRTLKVECQVVAKGNPNDPFDDSNWLVLTPSSPAHEPVRIRICDAYHLAAAFYETATANGLGNPSGRFFETIQELLEVSAVAAMEASQPKVVNKIKGQGVAEFFDILLPTPHSEEEDKQRMSQQWSGIQLATIFKAYMTGKE